MPDSYGSPWRRLAAVALGRLLRADQVIEHREDAADGESEDGEDEDREVALEHWGGGCLWCGRRQATIARRSTPVAAVIHPPCDNLLHSDFPHQQAEFRPFWADIGHVWRPERGMGLMPEVHIVVGCCRDPPQPRRLRRRRRRLVPQPTLDPVLVSAARGPGLGLPPGRPRRPARLHQPRAAAKTSTTSTGCCRCWSPSSPRAPAPAPPSASSARPTSSRSTPRPRNRSPSQIVRREMGIMAVSCGVIFFLALRAAGTSGHL